MSIHSVIDSIAGSIFSGTMVLVPCLVIIHFLKISTYRINRLVLIQSLNTVLLLGSVLYIIMWLLRIYSAIFLGAEYEQYVFAGSFWFFAATAVINRILLPQILWVKRFRKSLKCPVIIVGIWVILRMINLIMLLLSLRDFSMGIVFNIWGNFLTDSLIYITILVITYFILNNKKRQLKLA